MCPSAIDIGPSIDMSIPSEWSWASVKGIGATTHAAMSRRKVAGRAAMGRDMANFVIPVISKIFLQGLDENQKRGRGTKYLGMYPRIGERGISRGDCVTNHVITQSNSHVSETGAGKLIVSGIFTPKYLTKTMLSTRQEDERSSH